MKNTNKEDFVPISVEYKPKILKTHGGTWRVKRSCKVKDVIFIKEIGWICQNCGKTQ